MAKDPVHHFGISFGIVMLTVSTLDVLYFASVFNSYGFLVHAG